MTVLVYCLDAYTCTVSTRTRDSLTKQRQPNRQPCTVMVGADPDEHRHVAGEGNPEEMVSSSHGHGVSPSPASCDGYMAARWRCLRSCLAERVIPHHCRPS